MKNEEREIEDGSLPALCEISKAQRGGGDETQSKIQQATPLTTSSARRHEGWGGRDPGTYKLGAILPGTQTTAGNNERGSFSRRSLCHSLGIKNAKNKSIVARRKTSGLCSDGIAVGS
ncbi:hypothetical protein VUR80DRAFT_2503 [Thermomyces stellatus]